MGKDRRVRLSPLLSCASACGRGCGEPGDAKIRAARRCSLPGFDTGAWDRAAHPDAATDSEQLADELVGVARAQGIELEFDIDANGCPWGWVVCRFAQHVAQHVGNRDASSTVRTPSLRLSRRMHRDEVEPTELLEAVELVEAHEDRCYAAFAEACLSTS